MRISYPSCSYTQLVEPEMLEAYFYFKNTNGMRCPHDHTLLTAAVSRYGIYAHCNGSKMHFFKLDEI